jgi:hypothetical protein
MFRRALPINIDNSASQASGAPFTSSFTVIINPFQRIIALVVFIASLTSFVIKDTYERLMSLYNNKYNSFKPAKDDLPLDYSPYVNRELLFNNKAVIVTNLLKGMILFPTTKKLNRL